MPPAGWRGPEETGHSEARSAVHVLSIPGGDKKEGLSWEKGVQVPGTLQDRAQVS
jgi:hypothetical protein